MAMAKHEPARLPGERPEMKILVTGAAGFIGSALVHTLLDRGDEVVGIDNLNDYYDVRLKQARLDRLRPRAGFLFRKLDIVERQPMRELFAAGRFDAVAHLAAQAGVRYSIENPSAYIDANIVGFLHVLEGCRHSRVGHLVFASSIRSMAQTPACRSPSTIMLTTRCR